MRHFSRFLFALFLRGDEALGTPAREQLDEASGDGRHRARDDAEGRQQRGQHRLRVSPHDERRNEVLAEHDVDRDAREQRGQRRHIDAGASGHDGEQDRRERKNQPQQQPGRYEQLERIVEVIAETVVPAALGHQAEGQLHEGAERRLDGPDVDRCHGKQEERQRNHARRPRGATARSMSPSRRPPLVRSRRSRRAIRPWSAGS